MRKIKKAVCYHWFAVLKCQKCGKTETLDFNVDSKKECHFPSITWNGWYLKDTELCPTCDLERSYYSRSKNGITTYTKK